MITATTIAEVRAHVSRWHAAAERVVFVPTMGNLHAGHVSLHRGGAQARRALRRQHLREPDAVRAERGLRALSAHARAGRAACSPGAGCDLMFMPEVGEIYPNGAASATRIEVPGISDILCGEFRPGHFEGVATVVAKLFHIVDPDVAIFGEKDFQQLTVIRRMVADLCLRVEIVGAPTVREADGLAMSSRNQYLDAPSSAGSAPTIYRQLQQAVAALESGVRDFARIEGTGRAALRRGGFPHRLLQRARCAHARRRRSPTRGTSWC